jgi:orotidine-5'-phosphate decarboxylase
MNYLDLLKKSSEGFNSIVCLGLDPVLEDIPIKSGSDFERIYNFYEEILNKILQRKIYPAAVKPNYAFYAQYGIEGLEALLAVGKLYKSAGFPLILDAKRGDIGKTAEAYAREAFQFFDADAVTLSPFLGLDSIRPFIKNYPKKGYYILNKTSNKSSGDFQDISIKGSPLYLIVSKKIIQWYHPGIGAVVGATYPDQLKSITKIFSESKLEIPYLIPGIGSQGGSIIEVIKVIKTYSDIRIHRINSSSAINYAYKRYTDKKFSEAAVIALDKLNHEINQNLS